MGKKNEIVLFRGAIKEVTWPIASPPIMVGNIFLHQQNIAYPQESWVLLDVEVPPHLIRLI